MIVVATAGWSIPRTSAAQFAGDGTQLARYARVLRGTEINTSFYRGHAAQTYANWARQTPRGFRFAVKLPQRITHEDRLRRARTALHEFLRGVAGLGSRLGPLVVQLPPSLPYEPRVARSFFALLRSLHDDFVVCEPRHASWFESTADELMMRHRIARIAADPAIVPEAALPGGWPGIAYYRLHGSPRKYWSIYDPARIHHWTDQANALRRAVPGWFVFDNTASGGAAGNALQMQRELKTGSGPGVRCAGERNAKAGRDQPAHR
jgi:uncharacterized protein YecE (DUF72 family)